MSKTENLNAEEYRKTMDDAIGKIGQKAVIAKNYCNSGTVVDITGIHIFYDYKTQGGSKGCLKEDDLIFASDLLDKEEYPDEKSEVELEA